VVYFATQNGKLYALSADSGAILWYFMAEAAIASSPNVVDGLIYVGSDDNMLRAIPTART